MRVDVRNAHAKRIRIRPIRRVVQRLLEAEGAERAEVSILLADDAMVRDLNAAYRGQDSPTDVLAFCLKESESLEIHRAACPGEPDILGDVVVSVDTAERQAAARGVGLEHEVAHLALHGTLHLVGYDDSTDEGLALMEQKAGRILASDCVSD